MSPNITTRVSRIQKNIIHTKNKEGHNWTEKRQQTDTNTEITQISESSDKNFKAVIINTIQTAISN